MGDYRRVPFILKLEQGVNPVPTYLPSGIAANAAAYAARREKEKQAEAEEEARNRRLATQKRGRNKAKHIVESDDDDTEWKVHEESKPLTKKKKSLPRVNWKKTISNASVKKLLELELNEFSKYLVWPTDEPSTFEPRALINQVLELHELKSASGGFKAFIGAYNDFSINRVISLILTRYTVEEAEKPLGIARILRHVWNNTSEAYRKEWEKKVRREAFKTNKGSEQAMPMSEYPISRKKAKNSDNDSSVTLRCCGSSNSFDNEQEFLNHILSFHDSVKLYACTFCKKAFTSERELTIHTGCEYTNTYIESVLGGKTMDVNRVGVQLACADCSLCFPLRPQPSTKGWNYLCALTKLHSNCTLVPIQIMYYSDDLTETQLDKVHVTFTRWFNCQVPVGCKECNIDLFNTLDEADKHVMEHHPEEIKICKKCDSEKKFGTELSYRIHTASHVKDGDISNFLKYSASYQPAPYSQRLPHIGLLPENLIMGDNLIEDDNPQPIFEEYVNVDENAVRQKMYNCISGLKGNDELPRTDIGYESFDYTEAFASDQELRTKLNEKMGLRPELKTTKVFETDVEIGSGISTIQTGIEGDLLANCIAEALKATCTFVLNKGYDPLRGNLLYAQEFCYCSECQTILTGEHACTTKLKVLFSPSKSPLVGANCVVDGCQTMLCSVHAIRIHAHIDHGLVINYKRNPNVSTSIVQLSSAVGGIASGLALATNSALTMITGDLELKAPYVDTTKPFAVTLLPRLEYDCQVCEFKVMQEKLKEHIYTYHSEMCTACGRLFSKKEFLIEHQQSCRRPVMIRCKSNPVPCLACGELLDFKSMVIVRRHVVECHLELIRYSQKEMIPTFDVTLVKFEPQLPSMGRPTVMVRPAAMTQSIYRINEDEEKYRQFSCFICGIANKSYESLQKHLEHHTEMITRCPYCRVPVGSLEEFERHLVNLHSFQSGGQRTCQFCQKHCGDRTPGQHLMYECLKTPTCWKCEKPNINTIEHELHMRAHYDQDQRFRCELCSVSFPTIMHFKDHSCKSSFYCECDRHTRFYSKADVYKHFNINHVEKQRGQFVCKICRALFPASATDIEVKIHTGKHTKTIGMERPNQCTILKPSSYQVRTFVAQPTRQTPIVVRPMARKPQTLSGGLGESLKGLIGCGESTTTISAPVSITNLVMGMTPDAPITLDEDDNIVGNGQGSSSASPLSVVLDQNQGVPESLCEILNQIAAVTQQQQQQQQQQPQLSQSTQQHGNEQLQDNQCNSTMTAEVREERQDDSYIGASCNVVDDENDEIVAVDPAKTAAVQGPVIRAVQDENADDDIAIVAEVDNSNNASTALVINNSSREKSLQCTKCSEKFITEAARQIHLNNAHSVDAGDGLCGETFELPVDVQGYVCRNCSLVFENENKYRNHVIRHSTVTLNCTHCSGIAFSQQLLERHQRAHRDGTIYYACGRCAVRFTTDLQLMGHLHKVHKVEMFFFCKGCGFGSLNINLIYSHITQKITGCCQKMPRIQRFGVCPATMLTFEPENEENYKSKVARVKTIRLSDCAHRSLLLAVEPFVSCDTCDCTVVVNMFLALKGTQWTSSFGKREDRTDMDMHFPFMAKLNNEMRRQALSDLKVLIAKGPIRPESFTIKLQEIYSKSPFADGNAMATATITESSTPMDLATMLSTSRTNGNQTRTDMAKRVVRTAVRMVPHSKNALQKNKGLILWRKLRSDGNDYTCGSCYDAFATEMEFLKHFFTAHHFAKARIHLCCPICSLEYVTFEAYNSHMQAHRKILAYAAQSCEARFASIRDKELHDNSHKSHLIKYDMDSKCCEICRTVNTWQYPLKKDNVEVMMCHRLIHGFNKIVACGICEVAFNSNETEEIELHRSTMHKNSDVKMNYVFIPRSLPLTIQNHD